MKSWRLRTEGSEKGFRIFLALIVAAALGNLIAFAMTVAMPPGFAELNTVPKGVSFSSAAFSELLILIGSVLLFLLVGSPMERNIIQSAYTAVLLADPTNDVLRVVAGPYVAVLFSYGLAAMLPTVFAIRTFSKMTLTAESKS